MTILFFIVITVCCFLSSLSVKVLLGLVEFLQHNCFNSFLHFFIGLFFIKCFVQHINLWFLECCWECDLEYDEKIAELERLFVEWKTLSFKSLQVFWLDDLSRGISDSDLFAVEVGNSE